MSDPLRMLEVVDESDKVIGLETRVKIHELGLLHREIHIWFITPQGEIIFQHRASNKDSYPDKLDATVAGHVEPNTSYEQTAIKECQEETGIDIKYNNLVFLAKLKRKDTDPVTGVINYSFRSQYAYLYIDQVSDLQIEKGKAIGFEKWKIENIKNLSETDKIKFIPVIFDKELVNLFDKAVQLLIK